MTLPGILIEHLRKNLLKYLLLIVIFALGITLGDMKSGSLEGETRSYLLNLVNQLINYGGGHEDGHGLFLAVALNQVKTVGLMWFLGLTVVGVPLILGMIFARAFSLGFTLGFLIQEKGKLGVVMALATVLPQNIFYIPFIIMGAVLSIGFSLFLVKGRFQARAELWQNFVLYTLAMIGILIVLLLGALIESYLAPWLLSLILS
ncbi:MAG: stage II sporulation protein M [Syntrophomonadaceae bacterium]|nr:stage II sporulation protein M [Syntrophomonadaceae bacterium]